MIIRIEETTDRDLPEHCFRVPDDAQIVGERPCGVPGSEASFNICTYWIVVDDD